MAAPRVLALPDSYICIIRLSSKFIRTYGFCRGGGVRKDMGHKEDLLAGAKQVLVERGYANATARDIVAASKTNLASIGYHYGSLDTLLTQAMIEMMGEWGGKFEGAASQPGVVGSEAKFRAVWRALFKLFETDRPLLLASFEIATRAERSEDLKAIFAETYIEVR